MKISTLTLIFILTISLQHARGSYLRHGGETSAMPILIGTGVANAPRTSNQHGTHRDHFLCNIHYFGKTQVVLASYHLVLSDKRDNGMHSEVRVLFPDGTSATLSQDQFHAAAQDVPRNEIVITEAPSSRLFLEVAAEFEDQIVETHNILRIIRGGLFVDLTENEIIIYERIQSRRPLRPEAYNIPTVKISLHDKVFRERIVVGVADRTSHRQHLRLIDVQSLSGAKKRLLTLMHGDELETKARTDGNSGAISMTSTYEHKATFWRDMWLVKALLPRGDAEIELARELDDHWLRTHPQNQRRHNQK